MGSITSGFCDAFLDDGHALFRGACARFAREEIAPHAWACSLLIECVLALRAMEKPASEFEVARAGVRRRSPSP